MQRKSDNSININAHIILKGKKPLRVRGVVIIYFFI